MTQKTRRQALSTLGAAGITTVLAGCSALTGTDENRTGTVENGTDDPEGTDGHEPVLTVPKSEMEEPSSFIAEAPVPAEPPTYPLIGSTDATATATLYGSWKCVHTEDVVSNHFQRLISDYVEPGDLAIEFRDLAYWEGEGYLGKLAPNAGNAGLAIWNEAPEGFWRYFGTVMANQPPEEKSWPTQRQLVAFSEFSEVGATDAMQTAMNENEYEDTLRETTTKVEETALGGIPRVVVGGTVTHPAKNPQAMYDAIEDSTSG